MPLHLTNRDIEDAHRYARDAMASLKGVGRADGALSKGVNLGMKVLATCVGAGIVGVVSGKYGSADLHIGGKVIPMDAVSGLAGLGVAACMEDGMASESLGNLSAGVLAAFTTKYTIGLGKTWAEKGSPFASKAQISGQAPVRRFASPSPVQAPLTEQQLANMAQALR
jgi:hypothetical protein